MAIIKIGDEYFDEDKAMIELLEKLDKLIERDRETPKQPSSAISKGEIVNQ